MRFSQIAIIVGGLGFSGVALSETSKPYIGLDSRPLKALSEQQIADLKAGRGAGFALAAELNGYPGPSHVLELAEALELNADQHRRTTNLFEAMKAETRPLGEIVVSQEADLDKLFSDRTVAPDSLKAATRLIAETTGRLRAAHLGYHLAMLNVLTSEQVSRYARLRGYGAETAKPDHGHGSHQ